MIRPRERYVLDTDFFINFFRGVAAARTAFAQLRPNQVFVAAFSYYEVMEGEYYRAPGRVGAMRRFFDGLVILPLTSAIAEVAAREQARLKKSGEGLLQESDLHIAATAVSHSMTLLTRNEKHFQRFKGLKYQRW